MTATGGRHPGASVRATGVVAVVLLSLSGCGIGASPHVTVTRTVQAASLLGGSAGRHVPPDTVARLAAALSSPPVSSSAASSLRNRIASADIARCTKASPAKDHPSDIVVSVCAGSEADAQQVLEAVLNAARDWLSVRAEEYPTLPVGYPVKPDVAPPPARSVFGAAATASARRVFAGKGVYVCNEIAGIAGPSCYGSKPEPDATVMADATAGLGVRQVWVRCGDSTRGFPDVSRTALTRFAARAHAAGLAVVCWDVPNLWDVRADALRLAQESQLADAAASDLESTPDSSAAHGYTQGGGFAGPELETAKGRRWAAAYAQWAREAAGPDAPLAVITEQPQTHPRYPFQALLGGFDVISPMAYRPTSWFVGGDPGSGELPRRGNPFVASAIAALRSSGVTADRYDIVVTGMVFNEDNLRSHQAQIATDIEAAKANGALGFAAFEYQAALAHPPWAATLRTFAW